MENTALIGRLEAARRRAKLGQDQIDRQRMVIATLFSARAEATEAENRLRVYEKLHDNYIADIERILRAMASPSIPRPEGERQSPHFSAKDMELFLEALRRAQEFAIKYESAQDWGSDGRKKAAAFHKAIDEFAWQLTGDREYFWPKPSNYPNRLVFALHRGRQPSPLRSL